MKRQLLVTLLLVLSSLVYGQTKETSKVYLTNGEVKEGKIKINDSRFSVAGVGIKGGKYMKEISLKPSDGKKETIGVERIKKVEFISIIKKETYITTYVPILISGELKLCREVVPNKLYLEKKVKGFNPMGNQASNTGGIDHSQRGIYYLKKGDNYEKTSFSALKKEYNCSMKEGKGQEEKMIRCLQGK